jgi:DNA-directed RNA polymerase subunit RPC12/RpoP
VLPFRARCERCSNRAHYTCQTCGKEFCIKHSKINRDLTVICAECTKK